MKDRSNPISAKVTMTIGLPPGLREPRHTAAARKVLEQLDPHVRRFLGEEFGDALRRLQPEGKTAEAGVASASAGASSRSSRAGARKASSLSTTETAGTADAGAPQISCAWEWDPVLKMWVFRCHPGT